MPNLLSDPMRSLVAREAFLGGGALPVAGALLGVGLYALNIGGLVAVPFAVIGLLMVGELYVFVTGDN